MRLFKQALNELSFLETKQVNREGEFTYVELINDLKLGVFREGQKLYIFLGESLRDFFRIEIFNESLLAFVIAIRAMRKTEQYRFAIMRQRYV